MQTDIDIDRVTHEVERLRGGLSDLAQTIQRTLPRQGDLSRFAQRAGSRARDIAERDAREVIDQVENNPAVVVSVAVAMGALLGLFLLARTALNRVRRAAHSPVKRVRHRAAAQLSTAPRKARKAARAARKTAVRPV